MKEFWTSFVTLLGVMASLIKFFKVVLPPELWSPACRFLSRAFHYSSYCHCDVTEIDGVNTNELYNAVQLYLSSFVYASASVSRISLTRAINSSATTFGLSSNDFINDVFEGVAVQWEHVVTQRRSQTFSWWPHPEEKRGFILWIRKCDRERVLNSYLDYIMYTANDISHRNRERLLHTNSLGRSLRRRGQY